MEDMKATRDVAAETCLKLTAFDADVGGFVHKSIHLQWRRFAYFIKSFQPHNLQ